MAMDGYTVTHDEQWMKFLALVMVKGFLVFQLHSQIFSPILACG
jgi:hypothetical protein